MLCDLCLDLSRPSPPLPIYLSPCLSSLFLLFAPRSLGVQICLNHVESWFGLVRATPRPTFCVHAKIVSRSVSLSRPLSLCFDVTSFCLTQTPSLLCFLGPYVVFATAGEPVGLCALRMSWRGRSSSAEARTCTHRSCEALGTR